MSEGWKEGLAPGTLVVFKQPRTLRTTPEWLECSGDVEELGLALVLHVDEADDDKVLVVAAGDPPVVGWTWSATLGRPQ